MKIKRTNYDHYRNVIDDDSDFSKPLSDWDSWGVEREYKKTNAYIRANKKRNDEANNRKLNRLRGRPRKLREFYNSQEVRNFELIGDEITREVTPEQDLWLAVLILALVDLTRREGGARYTEYIRKASIRWINALEETEGAFIWVCDALNINAPTLRTKLKATDYLNGVTLTNSRCKIKRSRKIR